MDVACQIVDRYDHDVDGLMGQHLIDARSSERGGWHVVGPVRLRRDRRWRDSIRESAGVGLENRVADRSACTPPRKIRA